MTTLTRIARGSATAFTALTLAMTSVPPTFAAEEVHFNPETIDVAAHWAARSTLANAVMFSGLGEPLSMTMDTRDAILKHAGYVTRPAMPDMAMVGAVYAAGDPALKVTPDFAVLGTLRWDPSTFDQTLDPAAQAWALIKITSPEFHLNFHDRKEDKRIALVMLPQARAQAAVLEKRLLTGNGLFAARRPDGTFAEPRARDQAIVLWGAANLILAATSMRDDYWHSAWRDLVDADDYRGLAARAFAAVEKLPPRAPADRALAIEALGRYALAAQDGDRRRTALALARTHADALRKAEDGSLEDVAFAVYGLIEAGRLLGDAQHEKAAMRLFRSVLVPKWDDGLGVFRTGEMIAYTPATTAVVAAALNAMRWHGSAGAAEEAARLYPRFLETVLVRAGLLLSSPLPLVPAAYRKDRSDAAPGSPPGASFAHPALPVPEKARTVPVFAGEVQFEQGAWRVSDRRFRTAEAMFLANMLVMPREGRADAFLPADRLARLGR